MSRNQSVRLYKIFPFLKRKETEWYPKAYLANGFRDKYSSILSLNQIPQVEEKAGLMTGRGHWTVKPAGDCYFRRQCDLAVSVCRHFDDSLTFYPSRSPTTNRSSPTLRSSSDGATRRTWRSHRGPALTWAFNVHLGDGHVDKVLDSRQPGHRFEAHSAPLRDTFLGHWASASEHSCFSRLARWLPKRKVRVSIQLFSGNFFPLKRKLIPISSLHPVVQMGA